VVVGVRGSLLPERLGELPAEPLVFAGELAVAFEGVR